MLDFRHTDALTLLRSLPDASVDLMVTDPPRGTQRHPFESWPEFFVEARRTLTQTGILLLFTEGDMTVQLITAAPDLYRYRMVHLKPNTSGMMLSFLQKRPLTAHEDVLVFSKGSGGVSGPDGGTTVLQGFLVERGVFHPAQKSLALMRHLIRLFSLYGQTVCDPFAGSASAGVAALQEARKFIGCELNAEYHHRAALRLERQRKGKS